MSKSIARKRLDTVAALSGAYSSEVTDTTFTDYVLYTVETSNVTTNTGQFRIEGRITDRYNNSSDWITLTTSPVIPALANANTSFAVEITVNGFTETRISFTPAGGTPNGTAQIFVCAKQVGGS